MPRRTLLFLAAITLTFGALILQFAWNYYQPYGPSEYPPIDLSALFDFEPPAGQPILLSISQRVRRLDGQKVRLTGEHVPRGGLWLAPHDFDLTPTLNLPKFTRPRAHWFVAVRVPPGQQWTPPTGPIHVYGTLHIREPSQFVRLYTIDADRIELVGGAPPTVLFPLPAATSKPPRDYKPLVTLLTTSSLAAAATLLAVWHVLRQRDLSTRAHRVCHNLCLTCGYDLRAASARCPECGTPVSTPAKN